MIGFYIISVRASLLSQTEGQWTQKKLPHTLHRNTNLKKWPVMVKKVGHLKVISKRKCWSNLHQRHQQQLVRLRKFAQGGHWDPILAYAKVPTMICCWQTMSLGMVINSHLLKTFLHYFEDRLNYIYNWWQDLSFRRKLRPCKSC